MHSVIEFYLFLFPTLELPLYRIKPFVLLRFWCLSESPVYYMVLGQHLGLHEHFDCFYKNIRS